MEKQACDFLRKTRYLDEKKHFIPQRFLHRANIWWNPQNRRLLERLFHWYSQIPFHGAISSSVKTEKSN